MELQRSHWREPPHFVRAYRDFEVSYRSEITSLR
jgi:hypothetical protein